MTPLLATRLVRTTGLAAVIVGCLVLLGWALHLDALRRVLPGSMAMNPTTALMVILLGAALFLETARPAWRGLRMPLVAVVLAVGAVEFAERLFGLELDLDRILFSQELRALRDPVPNHMGANAALCLFLLATALGLSSRPGKRSVTAAQLLALAAAWIALVAVIGYVYRISHLSPYATYLPMALHTGLTLVALSAGVLLLHAERGLVGVLFRRDPGGQLLRRLLPAFVLFPVALGYLRLLGERRGLFDSTVGVSLLIATLIATSVGLVWWLAASLSRTSAAREEVERALRLSEALLSEAQTIAHLGSWEHCPKTGAMAWSDEMYRLLGFAPNAVSASLATLFGRVHPDDRAFLQARLEAGEPFSAPVRIVRPGDEGRVLAMRYETIVDPGGQAARFVGVAQDVTEQQAIERLKDEFISVVSHELRTPLTAIRGSLGLLATGRFGVLNPKGQDMLEVAARNSDRLVRLINDILDVERMASGATTLQVRTCRADELIQAAVEAMAAVAHKAGVGIRVEASALAFEGDADRLIQVMINLLDNALKFSPPGGRVTLRATDAPGEVRFAVSDHGRGIPPDRLESIFERFGQVDASDSRKKGGTGLGLTICRSIVQLHGGRIWAESELGEGSRFSFCLPVRQEAGSTASPARRPG